MVAVCLSICLFEVIKVSRPPKCTIECLCVIEILLTMINNFFPFISFVFAKRDGTDEATDGGTDTAAYRDAETHLKSVVIVCIF